ncbi:MAG: short-chain dehydrogenase [Gammaproteobacteria bacterium]|nr:short-chain dehydrogenase [Gammaproteobacteria bacterium]
MQDFNNKIAVVTGGGTGMGRELVCQLIAAGAHVAMCDVSAENMAQTHTLASPLGQGRLTSHNCDVSSEQDVLRFRDEVAQQHDTQHINLLFNNAGIAGGGSVVDIDRQEWERTFGVCWYGVFYGCTAFMPMLVASDEAHIINTSSVNGFWATVGPMTPHSSYSAAKFAVKGFTEALITDLRMNAPHVRCSVVMPGHIGTSIALNTSAVLGKHSAMELDEEEVADIRERYLAFGLPVDNVPDDHIRQMVRQQQEDFRDKAPTTASAAATIILDGVREQRWRILVGEDAKVLDAMVRQEPEQAYEVSFLEKLNQQGHMGLARNDEQTEG